MSSQDTNLPPTDGFFFGASNGSEPEDDLAFIAKAREAIADGDAAYYYAWWSAPRQRRSI